MGREEVLEAMVEEEANVGAGVLGTVVAAGSTASANHGLKPNPIRKLQLFRTGCNNFGKHKRRYPAVSRRSKPFEWSDPCQASGSHRMVVWKEARMKKLLKGIVSEGMESGLLPSIVDAVGLDLGNNRSQGAGTGQDKDGQAGGRGGGRGGGSGRGGRGGGKGCSGNR